MKTVIGLDYGTQAARGILVDTATGKVLCSHTVRYAHGVVDGDLADAEDYEAALEELIQKATPKELRDTVVGICVDATSFTLVGVDKQGRILAQIPEYKDRLHAQIKLWKYHRAQKQADEAQNIARKMGEKFLGRTGGSVSSEWALPKLLEMKQEDPEVYEQMDLAFDLCEFLTYRLTGTIKRSAGSMCYKGLWSEDLGFPSDKYLNTLADGFAEEYKHRMRGEVLCPSEAAGYLKQQLCEKFGLQKNVIVAAGVLDGHTALAALGALHEGDGALVIGTSNVFTIQTPKMREVEGICGIAFHGLTPGLYGIDSGQSGTGDMLEWYVKNALPEEIGEEAKKRGISEHQILTERIENPWENRVIAADWWNGSRNVPCNLQLKGTLYGISLQTKPEEVYLALLQSIVCGTGKIIQQCESYGIMVKRLLATGGITGKNPFLMQEYANLLNREILVGEVEEGPALGTAIFAAVAAGIYETSEEAYRFMGVQEFVTYKPDQEHQTAYQILYEKNAKLRNMAIEMEQV